jgi:hypothetical protein
MCLKEFKHKVLKPVQVIFFYLSVCPSVFPPSSSAVSAALISLKFYVRGFYKNLINPNLDKIRHWCYFHS